MESLNLETVTWERAALLIVVCGLSTSAITEACRQILNAYIVLGASGGGLSTSIVGATKNFIKRKAASG